MAGTPTLITTNRRKRNGETESQQELRRETEATRNRPRRALEAPEERRERLDQNAERHRAGRTSESAEQQQERQSKTLSSLGQGVLLSRSSRDGTGWQLGLKYVGFFVLRSSTML